MKKFVLNITLIFFAATLIAQNSEMRNIQVSDFYIYSGVHNGGFEFSFEDFQKLAPQSELLKQDFSDFKNGYAYDFSNGNFLTVKLGLDFINKERNGYRSNPQLQIGFTYQTNNSADYSKWSNESVRVDTLTSSSAAYTVYVDSTYSTNITADYRSDNFLLDLALIYNSDDDARWSFYGGVGLAAGVSINAQTEINSYSTESIVFSQAGTNQEYYFANFDFLDNTYEKFNNDMNILAWAQLPLGINFKVAKSSRFWKDLNLFYEVTPMMKFWSVPETGGYINVGVKHGIGLKVNVR